jgi:PAS domain-containing protein
MKKNPNPPADAAELRRRAEDRFQTRERNPQSAQRLVHELKVHQIELEMQNEELQRARAKADALLAQYTDLYDFAPAGYFNLARDGTILAVNLTGARLLGLERAQLLKRRFGSLVSEPDRPALNACLEKTFAGTDRECCEVALLTRIFHTPMKTPPVRRVRACGLQASLQACASAPVGRVPSRGVAEGEVSGPRAETGALFVRIEAVVSAGRRECRAAVLDVTDRHRAEAEQERLVQELQSALARVKLLSGLLPICANCKSIRNDEGYWKQIESYISSHSEATFSHGICPECLNKLYPELEQQIRERTGEKERQNAAPIC